MPDGTLSGFDVDYAKAICAEIKRKCVFVEQAWGGIIPALSAKKFDVIISSMSITEARKKVVLFTDKYSAAINRMVAKKGSTIDASVASLAGKKIGVAKGSTQETFAKKVYEKSGATVVSYANAAESYLDLAAGRVDAVIASALNVKKPLLLRACFAQQKLASWPTNALEPHEPNNTTLRRATTGRGFA